MTLRLLLIVFCFSSLSAKAQDWYENYNFNPDSVIVNLSRPKVSRFIELGVSANAYRGDLSTYSKWTSVYHIGVQWNPNKKLKGRLGIGIGFVTGENRAYTFPAGTPNIFFRSPIFTLDYEVQYHLIRSRTWMLYISQGIGLMRFDPQDEFKESLINLPETRALDENYGKVAFMLPTRIGWAYILKNGYGIGMQVGFMNVQSDYIDNISNWGKKTGNDNVLQCKFMLLAPLQKTAPKPIPLPSKPKERDYSHPIFPIE
jgi:hypothetical protein